MAASGTIAPPKGRQVRHGHARPDARDLAFREEGSVDQTVYDTTSILATIEKRFGLTPLTSRDQNAKDMSAAFDFTK